MKQGIRLVFAMAVVSVLALPAQAQEWSAEQLEVWEVVSQQWELERAEDLSWLDLLHDSFQGWPIGAPHPFDKGDVERYWTVDSGENNIIFQDRVPMAIVVAGDTAVVHYLYTVVEDEDGEREFLIGRSTDVLTRTEDGWRFVATIFDEQSDDHL